MCLQVHSGDDHVQPGHTGDRQAQRAADQRARLHDGAPVYRELRHHRHHPGLQQRAAAADAAPGQPRRAHHHQPVHKLVRSPKLRLIQNEAQQIPRVDAGGTSSALQRRDAGGVVAGNTVFFFITND